MKLTAVSGFFQRQSLKKPAVWCLLLLIFFFALASSLSGVDFGKHWDEHIFIDQIFNSFRSGLLLTHYYIYPSLTYRIGLLAVAPEIFRYLVTKPAEPGALGVYRMQFKSQMLFFIKSVPFKLRLRRFFAAISMLAIFWLYGLVRVWRNSRWEALLAAALLAFSWEFIYHSRWAVPDALMLQFTVLTFFFLAKAWRRPERGWFWIQMAAAGAALTCGTKYQGGSLLLPVWVTLVWQNRRIGGRYWMARAAGHFLWTGFLFTLVYLATTPGTILDPFRFFQHLVQQMDRYQVGHVGYTVMPGLEHYGLLLQYFAFAGLSPVSGAAFFLFLLALAGMAVSLRRLGVGEVAMLVFFFFYLFYMGLQRVMIVRNMLLLLPFWALFAARGGAWVAGRLLQVPRWHFMAFAVWTCLLTGLVCLNAGWNAYAAGTILNKESIYPGKALMAYLDRHPAQKFLLSPEAAQLLRPSGRTVWPNVTGNPDEADYAVLLTTEVQDEASWTANRHGMFRHVFPPYEVNLDYYPTWIQPHLVVLSDEEARKLF